MARGCAVADNQDLSKRLGLTRGKMVLIGILAAVLIGVMYIQYGTSDTEEWSGTTAAPAYTPPGPPQLPQTISLPTAATVPTDGAPAAVPPAPAGQRRFPLAGPGLA